MVKLALHHLRMPENSIFLVAKNKEDQELMRRELSAPGRLRDDEIYLITGDTPLTLESDDKRPIRVAITTYRHATGYTLSKMQILITSVYFADETVRSQLISRIVRLSQKSPSVNVITVHTGILSEVFRRYQQVGSMAAAQKSMAEGIIMKKV